MKIIELKVRNEPGDETKLAVVYAQLRDILIELNKKEMPAHVINSLNSDIEELNTAALSEKEMMKLAKDKQAKILKLVEQEMKYVPKNHFRNIWLALGIAAFGLPLGLAFGLSIGNMAMLGVGLPIGLVMGLVVGTKLDKKAEEEGRQLDVELK